MNIDAAGSAEDRLAAAEVALREQVAHGLDEEVEPGGGVVADVRGHVGAGGGDELVLVAGALHLRQPQAVAAEVDPDRVALAARTSSGRSRACISPLPGARRVHVDGIARGARRVTYDSPASRSNREDSAKLRPSCRTIGTADAAGPMSVRIGGEVGAI